MRIFEKQVVRVFFRHSPYVVISLPRDMLSWCLWPDHEVLYASVRTSALYPVARTPAAELAAQIYKVQDFSKWGNRSMWSAASFINFILIATEKHLDILAVTLLLYPVCYKIIRPKSVLLRRKFDDIKNLITLLFNNTISYTINFKFKF